MKSRLHRIAISLALIFSLATLPIINMSNAATSSHSSKSRQSHSSNRRITFERSPLRFEINQGQTDSEVRFIARERDGIAYLTPGGATLQVTKLIDQAADFKPRFRNAAYNPNERIIQSSFVRLKTVGANPNPRMTGLERLPGVTNYLIGNDPRKWRTNVAAYRKVKYESVYQGIDLVYYGNDSGRLEYDFIVKPGANPDQIAVSIEGAERVELDSRGDLVISAATGKIRQPAPRIYQEANGKREQIAGRYRLLESDREIRNPQVAFELSDYDESRELVIDPEVVYATYLGGSSTSTAASEGAADVAVDDEGSVYIAGTTVSADFPTRNPQQGTLRGFSNAFITKLDANGQLVYSTYLGGSSFDDSSDITVDETGAVYVGGSTTSFDFPTVNPIRGRRNGLDAFITKLSPAGSQIVYSTYLGGNDVELVEDLALDEAKNLFALGSIRPSVGGSANDFPTVNPIQGTHGGGFRDGFMSVISPTGANLLYSTYLGGDGDDFFQTINVDPSNKNVLLSFFTNSSDFLTSGSSVTIQSIQGTPRKENLKGGFRDSGNGEFIFDIFGQLVEDIIADFISVYGITAVSKPSSNVGLGDCLKGLLYGFHQCFFSPCLHLP